MTKYEKGKPGNLFIETIELLRNRPRPLTFAAIEEATGIDARWLESFSAGKILDPSVNRIEILNNFLKS